MAKNNRKIIFIGGSSYSGSTMLDMMLSNSPDGFSLGEVYALFRPFRPHHFNPDCGCGNPDCDFWGKIRQVGAEFLYQAIFSMLPDISFIVDSSKDPWWIKKQSKVLQQQGFDVHHLLIWKEPAAFAHSMLKRGEKGWEKSWKNYYRLYITFITDFIPVPYNELVQHPSETLHKLCNKIGLIYHKDQEQFWQKQHHTLFGNDSAKIHLHNGNSNNFRQCQNKLTQKNDIPKHRSIYYDFSYLNSLPASVMELIENDSTFQNILMQFNSENLLSAKKNAISFSPVQVFSAKIRWNIKAIIGRVFGRYRLIF
jgi:hypothetical protein